jgi:HAD superfamily hydrolase (TIGR01509 family)
MKKLIIFDCDGVLVDSEIIASRLTSERLKSLGFELSTEDVAKILIGTDAKTAKKAFSEISPTLADNLVHIAKEEILDAYEQELTALIYPFVEYIATKTELKICVVSNNLKEKVLKALEFTKQIHFFHPDEIFTTALVENGKPAPDLFLYARKHFNVMPEDCLVIEDSAAGIKGAIAANIDVIAFLGGSHTKFEWYKERIATLKVPTVNNVNDLHKLALSYLVKF